MCAFQIPMNMDYDVMTKIGEQSKVIRERKYQVERFEKYAPRFRDSPSALSKNFMKDIVEPVCFGSDPRASLLRMITREPRLRLIRKRCPKWVWSDLSHSTRRRPTRSAGCVKIGVEDCNHI